MRKSLSTLSLLIFCGVLFSGCSPKPVIVQGSAMLPAFRDGDRILIDENIGELKRGDVISFLYPKDTSKWYIKRIIGLPGEKIEIKSGKIYINDQILDEPYLDEKYNQNNQNFAPRIVAENTYFVIGDNRDNSSDSRYWGTVPKDLIKGKYLMNYSKGEK